MSHLLDDSKDYCKNFEQCNYNRSVYRVINPHWNVALSASTESEKNFKIMVHALLGKTVTTLQEGKCSDLWYFRVGEES